MTWPLLSEQDCQRRYLEPDWKVRDIDSYSKQELIAYLEYEMNVVKYTHRHLGEVDHATP